MTEQNHTGHSGLSSGAASGSHSSLDLNSANLNAALQAFADADRVFFADLNELNNSEAEGGALLLLRGNRLTVVTAARGVEAGQVHLQHIHGFADGSNATVPTLAQDDDRQPWLPAPRRRTLARPGRAARAVLLTGINSDRRRGWFVIPLVTIL